MNEMMKTVAIAGGAVALAILASTMGPKEIKNDLFSDQGQLFFPQFTDPNAADQGCVDGTDGIDTDTTALVVSQLAAIPSRSAQVDAAIDTPLAVPLVKAGRLRALAITGAQRWRDLPEVPTVAESGVPGFDVGFWLAWMAHAQTPPPVLAALQSAVGALREDAGLMRQLLAHGQPGFVDPQAFAARLRAEHEAWGEVIRREKLTLD